jgi:hypothetical protein
MYYELFDEIRHSVNSKQKISWKKLVNKSYIDSFYEVRSEISPIFDFKVDLDRLIQKNYPYLLSQKILSGMAKGIFLGLKPEKWMEDMLLPSGRIKVPETNLTFDLEHPCLYIKKQENISFADTSLQVWENAFLKIAPDLEKNPGIKISREGFKAQVYRILEFIYGMKCDSPKRSPWVEFIHLLMIHGKTFTLAEIKQNYQVEEAGDWLVIRDTKFKTRPYLEYVHNRNLGLVKTSAITEVKTDQNDKTIYSALNTSLLGKLPLCHFSIGELMFISKDEYQMNQYYEWYIQPWTTSKDISVAVLDNNTFEYKKYAISDFANVLKTNNYAIVLGFTFIEDGKEVCFSAEPKMLKG